MATVRSENCCGSRLWAVDTGRGDEADVVGRGEAVLAYALRVRGVDFPSDGVRSTRGLSPPVRPTPLPRGCSEVSAAASCLQHGLAPRLIHLPISSLLCASTILALLFPL